MKFYFSDNAKWRINDTAEYIKGEFGRRAEQDFKGRVRDTVRLLRRNPCLGPVEPLLADRPTTYRSVVVANMNKMVYRITDDCIEIADFWDCRREPKALVEQTRGVEN